MSAIEMTGRTFGRLTVLGRAEGQDSNRGAMWMCRCECGAEKSISGSQLRRPKGSRSCGCLQRENARGVVTHGHSLAGRRTPEYAAWLSMRNRCFHQDDKTWPNYGGRGITVCQEWADSFEAFFRDVGPRPGKGFSLGRIDNEGHYEPGNVRWETSSQQNSNRRPWGRRSLLEMM